MKLTHAPILVSDQDKALKFYTEILGFEKRQDYQQPGHARWLTIAPKGQELELAVVKAITKVERSSADALDAGGNQWVFHTDDCRRDVAALKAKGVRFRGEAPMENPFGVTAYFTDPDGNALALLQPRSRQAPTAAASPKA